MKVSLRSRKGLYHYKSYIFDQPLCSSPVSGHGRNALLHCYWALHPGDRSHAARTHATTCPPCPQQTSCHIERASPPLNSAIDRYLSNMTGCRLFHTPSGARRALIHSRRAAAGPHPSRISAHLARSPPAQTSRRSHDRRAHDATIGPLESPPRARDAAARAAIASPARRCSHTSTPPSPHVHTTLKTRNASRALPSTAAPCMRRARLPPPVPAD